MKEGEELGALRVGLVGLVGPCRVAGWILGKRRDGWFRDVVPRCGSEKLDDGCGTRGLVLYVIGFRKGTRLEGR